MKSVQKSDLHSFSIPILVDVNIGASGHSHDSVIHDTLNYAVKNKWSIYKMTPKTTNLEDIFRNLTMKGDADA